MIDGLVILSARHGGQTQNMGSNDVTGSNRTTPDPLSYTNRAALGKLVLRATPQDTFKLTVTGLDNRLGSNGLSALSSSVTGYRTDNALSSERVSIHYEHDDPDSPLMQRIRASLYYRQAENNQSLLQSGSTTRARSTRYSEDAVGGNWLAESRLLTGSVEHNLVYGIDLSQSRLATSATGTGWTTCTGSQYCQYFPTTNYRTMGVYLQDDVHVGALSLIPGMRFDAYDLTPQTSTTYDAQASANGENAVSSAGRAWSPRLAVLYQITPALIPYVQYARGFRAPSPDEVNSFFKNSGAGYAYQQISNPDLKPETSNSFELGLRGKAGIGSGNVRYSTALFYGQYKNFINLLTIGGSMSSPTNPLTYQYVNAATATIYGWEARVDWQLANGFSAKGGIAYTKGTQTNAAGINSGLDSVMPLTVVAGLRYEPTPRWFAQSTLTYNAGKSHSDMSTPSDFAPPSFVIADLNTGYRIDKHTMLYAGIQNLFNKKYWLWNDVRGLSLAQNTSNLDAYTQSGRTFNISAKFEY